jgi:general stress protein CsbA
MLMNWRNGTLHRVHLYADLSISVMAIIGLFFAEILETWFQVDLIFHIAIFVLATGGIIAERILHRHKHSGVIGE